MSLPRLVTFPFLTLIAVALFAAPASARRGGGGPGGAEPTPEMKAAHSLRTQIVATELHQALNLDPEQASQLATLIREATARQAAHRAERQAAAPELVGILEDYLADVQANGVPSAETAAALQAFREDNRPEPGERKEVRGAMREQIQALLSEAQLEALRDFRPSLMPEPGPEDGQQGERLERRRRGDGPDRERGEAKGERGERRHRQGARHLRKVLMSPEMLQLLEG